MEATSPPSAADLLSVRSRVSWGAITAGAMIALTIYILLSMLGLALGIEAAVRGTNTNLGAGTAIYSILALLLAMFFGGWATSRLAVGESKMEAVLYGLILWGVLFLGMVWLVGAGLRTGFGAIMGTASGVYTTPEGQVDSGKVARDLKQAGLDDATVNKYRDYYDRVRSNPGSAPDVGRDVSNDPDARSAGSQAAQGVRQGAWWTLIGVVTSLAAVIFGSLVGSGEYLQPVPIIGVKRVPRRV